MPNFDRLAGKRSFCLPATLLLLASSAFSQSTAPKLIPAPRELHATTLLPFASATVVAPNTNRPEANSADLFTARDLTQTLTDDGIRTPPAAGSPDLTIDLLPTTDGHAQQLLAEAHLTFTPAMHDEGYVLITRPGHAFLIADTPTGRFYAAQTLKQLIERSAPAEPASGPPPSATGPP